jgi:hypothetical protein
LDLLPLRHIALLEDELRMSQQALEAVFLHPHIIGVIHIVNAYDAVTCL